MTYATSAPAAEYDARTPAVTYAAPARVIEHVAPAQGVHDVAPAPAVAVGSTGFHCEVIRIGDRDFEGQIRVCHADEDSDDWRSGTWIPSQYFRPDRKRARVRP